MRLMARAPFALLAFGLACVVIARAGRAQPPRLGTIDFPTSGSAAARPYFVTGVLYLHSFEYGDALKAFRKAQDVDPSFAMAYWGEAMTYTHPVWNEQDRPAALAALGRLARTREARRAKAPTPREQGYLEAIEILYGEGGKASRDTAYADAMERLAAAYPTDLEAKAFHALALLGLNQGVRDVPAYMRAAAIADEVFRANPDHPGAAHYLIHSFDDPVHAPLGLRAARAYSEIAPGAAHAQHMTTHIFVAMGMWDAVVSQNEIASGHDHHAWTPGHYTLWLEYGYLQQGRYADALHHLRTLHDNLRSDAPNRQRFAFALARAHYVVNTEQWENPEAALPVATNDLDPDVQAATALVEGLAAYRRGRPTALAQSLDRVARMPHESPSLVPIVERQLRALAMLDRGAADSAVALLRDATAREDAMPVDFGPPALVKPSHELFGEILLQLRRPREAEAEFQRALTLAPKRARSLLGLARASAAAGDERTAARAYAELRQIWHRADAGMLELAER
jgi:tetratricopeptide (TPR) repeat protein